MSASVWTYRLSWNVLPALLGVFLRHGRFRLAYLGVGRGAGLLARLLEISHLVVAPPRHVPFTGHGERVDDPTSPAFLIQARVNNFCDRVLATHRPVFASFTYRDPRVTPERVRVNLRKAMAHTTYELLGFVEFARYCEAALGTGTRTLVVISPAAVLANAVSGWAGEGIEFRCPWSRHHSVALRLARLVVASLLDACRPARRAAPGPATIAVEAAWGLDRGTRLNDLFWWWNSEIAADRVVLFFDQTDLPARRDVVARAEQLGIRCVVVDRRGVGDSPRLLWRPAPGPRVALSRIARGVPAFCRGVARGHVRRWVASRTLDMLHWSGRWEDFLNEFNVRGAFHTVDSETDHVSLACEAVGAARIGLHWSNLHWPQTYHARLHQVFFVWGPLHARLVDEVGSRVDHVLVSGCIAGGRDEDGEPRRARAEVLAAGASRVLTLFDTSLPCEGFYEFFLHNVIDDPRWGLLIKPKGADSPPWALPVPKLGELYERARATGRVRILDHRVSPAAAAAGADFAVGVDINSATVIAALSGHRAIHLDYVRLQESPLTEWALFHRTGAGRVVFSDPQRLWDRLNRHYDAPADDDGLGRADASLLREIDWFRDERADERIGRYLRWYLEALDRGLDRDDALQLADRRYAAQWGRESVVHGAAVEGVGGVESHAVSGDVVRA